jgi:(S)-2-hydroxyglutarate dehydrogenase
MAPDPATPSGHDADVAVVGGGIVGLATARALGRARPGLAVVVLDKEDRVAAHQSGRNSGVVHAGIYYRPDSEKARLVAAGRRELETFAREHGVPYHRCGKVVVATDPGQLSALAELRRRGTAHGVDAEWLDRRGLAAHEPHVDGVAGLFVPSTGVIDFVAVCHALVDELTSAGGSLALGHEVVAISDRGRHVELALATAGGGSSTVHVRAVVTCAGLHADLVAGLAGAAPPGIRIVPFRGEYFHVRPERDHLVRHLVYPVPDPRFPFLGVHFTRGVDGHVHAGPSAVPALAREGYSWRERETREMRAWLQDSAARHLARRYWRTGIAEIVRSVDRGAFTRALQRLVPDVQPEDLVPVPAGVRAQALGADGTLLDDFVFGEGPRVVSVLNAPSPAATASLAIGAHVAERVLNKLDAIE